MTTMKTETSIPSGAPSARSMLTSTAIHAAALGLMLLIPVGALGKSTRPTKEFDVVFYRPPKVQIPARTAPPPPKETRPGGPKPGAPTVAPPEPKRAAPGPSGKPDLKPGLEGAPPQAPPQPQIGNTGILAFKDKLASLAQGKAAPRLGSDAHYNDADNGGHPTSPSRLTTSTPGSSGGIDVASLNLKVGTGGGGGGHGGGPGGDGMPGLPVGRATSTIAGIGGGDRPVSHGGAGASRTDEEIQIVFDRYKASFYRLYNRALRNDPTLRGQMVLRLTIEPDGSVSMCKLQSSDMNAPDLSVQVVGIVKTINFGAKPGVQTVTISYPIDFLPAQ